MASLPVEVFLGISFGVLTGVVLALFVGLLGFCLKYYTDETVPAYAVAIIALSLGAVNLVYVDVFDAAQPPVEQLPRLVVATVVLVMLGLYGYSQGEKIAAGLPQGSNQTVERKQTLSSGAVGSVDGMGQVTVRASGEIRDMEGYPPLSPDLRERLAEGAWRLPADLPLTELETRLEDQLERDHGLADVSVAIDRQGRATIAAAPPKKGIARRIPKGWRAVSLSELLPTGLSPGDEVSIRTSAGTVVGTVLSASVDADVDPDHRSEPVDHTDPTRSQDEEETIRRARSTTDGGYGRVTVAVPTAELGDVLQTEQGQVRVRPRGPTKTSRRSPCSNGPATWSHGPSSTATRLATSPTPTQRCTSLLHPVRHVLQRALVDVHLCAEPRLYRHSTSPGV